MRGFANIILIALAALTAVDAVPELAGAQVEKRQSQQLQFFDYAQKVMTSVL